MVLFLKDRFSERRFLAWRVTKRTVFLKLCTITWLTSRFCPTAYVAGAPPASAELNVMHKVSAVWKVVFWLMAISFAMQLVSVPLTNAHSVGDTIGLIFNGFSLIPLYGYSYQVTIGTKHIAILIFSINCLGIILGIYVVSAQELSSLGSTQLVSIAIAIVLAYVYIYPQYAYAFKSNALWRKNA